MPRLNKAEQLKADQLAAARAEFEARRNEELAAANALLAKQAEALAAFEQSSKAQRKQPHVELAAHVNIEDMMAGLDMPSPTRVIVGCLLGLASAGAVGYGIGSLMVYALAGIATLTGGAFLTFALSVIVWILGIYAAWKIGGWVAGKVFSSVVLPDGLASRSYESVAGMFSGAKDKATSVLGSAKDRVEQFTGAHVVRQAGSAA